MTALIFNINNMRKSDKKIENNIRTVLTEVCQLALEDIEGFVWLTHTVNFQSLSESLCITCVFDTNSNLANYLTSSQKNQLVRLIESKLASIGIKLKNKAKQISLDSEESCAEYQQGNWRKRLS